MVTRLIVVIIPQGIQVLNHYVVYTKTNMMLYVNHTSID